MNREERPGERVLLMMRLTVAAACGSVTCVSVPERTIDAWVREHRFLAGYPGAEAVSKEDVLELPCDVLISVHPGGAK